MADQQQGLRIAPEVVLEPQARLEVEVVGRLVQQQQVGLGEQHGGERHAHAPAAREARSGGCCAASSKPRPWRIALARAGAACAPISASRVWMSAIACGSPRRSAAASRRRARGRRQHRSRGCARRPAPPGRPSRCGRRCAAGYRRHRASVRRGSGGAARSCRCRWGRPGRARCPAGRCTLACSSSSRPPMRRVTSFRCNMARGIARRVPNAP